MDVNITVVVMYLAISINHLPNPFFILQKYTIFIYSVHIAEKNVYLCNVIVLNYGANKAKQQRKGGNALYGG